MTSDMAKTHHPLSSHALDVLRQLLTAGPMPRQEINPGVARRLESEDLIEEVGLPSPYKTHCGQTLTHSRITPAGTRRVCEAPIQLVVTPR